jgi:hypothetical protein
MFSPAGGTKMESGGALVKFWSGVGAHGFDEIRSEDGIFGAEWTAWIFFFGCIGNPDAVHLDILTSGLIFWSYLGSPYVDWYPRRWIQKNYPWNWFYPWEILMGTWFPFKCFLSDPPSPATLHPFRVSIPRSNLPSSSSSLTPFQGNFVRAEYYGLYNPLPVSVCWRRWDFTPGSGACDVNGKRKKMRGRGVPGNCKQCCC